ncbi:uncharacterized protein LOC113334099 [Papaver somniferum]|uniref:uncharacterized protein LOC113334099 n=1 Tax=Papaver somniferum TaxID=3469 RepID=UPI000E6F6A0F|nr:uncharacterized protein LOC113334099 [Papaver somniferum]
MSNNDWFLQISSAKLLHLNFTASDHCHVFLITDSIPKHLWRPFKFFRTWIGQNSFKDKLEQSWNLDVLGSPAYKLKQKQHSARLSLSQWNRLEFWNIQRNIYNLQNALESAQNENYSESQHARVKSITSDLENWYKIQSEFYKEKSRDKTGPDKDNNTKYFHTMVNKRRHTNNISVLCDNDGNWLRDREDINNLLTSHFRTVASTSNPVLSEENFDVIACVLSDVDNALFHAVSDDIEIENVVRNMPAWSSPGPDGFQAGFYQTQWSLVGKDVINVVKRFFESGHMPRCLNKTYISLIPKCKSPKNPSEFRPIRLCNASYKIVSKILANKIRPLLKKLISSYQDAFVPGRAIHDNIIIAHELIHTMKHKECISGTMDIKLDISKAFDRLECNNLSPNDCSALASALNMSLVTDFEKYLGAPLLLGHSKRNFWWGHKTGKGIKFIGWDNINLPKDQGGLGFRYLEKFNIALICKLVWKIVTEHDEFWVNILSAKYFKDYSILHLQKLNENYSWIWRGLDHPPRPFEGLVNTISYTTISELFIADDASKIIDMNIPLIGFDVLIWLPDRKGQFSVKSVYNVLTDRTNLPVSNQHVPNQVWRSLWKVALPHKVKLFVWKCMKDIIPTKDKLSRYKPEIEVHCSLYNCPVETSEHLFLDCPYARSIWLADNINVGINIAFGSGIDRQDINRLLMVASWTIWKDRCSKDVKWIPPDYEFLKCNIDASFKNETLQGGLGLIIRDFAGTSIAVQGIHINEGMRVGIEVEELKCKAMKEVVALEIKLKMKKVIFESDSEVLVKSINGPGYFVHWLNQSFILDIKFMLSFIESWRCISVRRDANSVADKIAKRARVMGVCFNFKTDLPLEIQEWIDQDKPVFD